MDGVLGCSLEEIDQGQTEEERARLPGYDEVQRLQSQQTCLWVQCSHLIKKKNRIFYQLRKHHDKVFNDMKKKISFCPMAC